MSIYTILSLSTNHINLCKIKIPHFNSSFFYHPSPQMAWTQVTIHFHQTGIGRLRPGNDAAHLVNIQIHWERGGQVVGGQWGPMIVIDGVIYEPYKWSKITWSLG